MKLTKSELSYPDGDTLQNTGHYCCRRGFLTDEEVDDWIQQNRQFAAPRYSSTPCKSLSGRLSCIRLLMCERLDEPDGQWYPPGFAMSQENFVRVEKSFGLSPATLPLITRSTGMEYYKLKFGNQNDGHHFLPSVCESRHVEHSLADRG